MQLKSDHDRMQRFLETCRQNRLKITPQRVAIFQTLSGVKTHPTADEIFQMMKKELAHISFDTVNRTLLTFAAIGVVEVVEIFGGAKRFDPDVSNHHHLYCLQCGGIIDFDEPSYDDLDLPETLPNGFHVISKRVVLKGVCAACSKHTHN